MFLHVIEAEYRGGFRIWLRFNDDTAGEVDLEAHLDGTVFEPLRDVSKFRTVRFDPDSHTIVWDNGADLSPEFLRELVAAEQLEHLHKA